MIILETYTTLREGELSLPDFLNITKEVTNDSEYSMYNLSRINDSDELPMSLAEAQREKKLAAIAKGAAVLPESTDNGVEENNVSKGLAESQAETLMSNGLDM